MPGAPLSLANSKSALSLAADDAGPKVMELGRSGIVMFGVKVPAKLVPPVLIFKFCNA